MHRFSVPSGKSRGWVATACQKGPDLKLIRYSSTTDYRSPGDAMTRNASVRRDPGTPLARLGACKTPVRMRRKLAGSTLRDAAPSKRPCCRGGERLRPGHEIYLGRALARFETVGRKTSQASRPALTAISMKGCHQQRNGRQPGGRPLGRALRRRVKEDARK